MIDDHFLIIEQAQAWVDKVNVDNWLPQLSKNPTPPGFSYFYTGLHYLLFLFLQKLNVYDPQAKMYVVRLLHALYSLLTVYFGYRITEKVSNERNAKQAGWLLALFWFWPVLSVRNLVEMVCIPMLAWATWLAVKTERKDFGYYFLAGIALGLAFNIRFQTLVFSGGFILALLIQKKVIPAVATGIGILVCACAIQGGIDGYIWGAPFVELKGYVHYNLQHATNFINLPWYNYLLLFAGMLIPPVSLFLLFGFFRSYKKHLLLFLPSFLFLVFHSCFPNKQERFILPIIPFIIILGVVGWNDYIGRAAITHKYAKALKYSWGFFVAVNFLLLSVVSFTYTKRSRVEAMCYLAKKGDVHNLIIENSNQSDGIASPLFYLQKWPRGQYHITNRTDRQELWDSLKKLPAAEKPNYALVYESDKLEERIAKLKGVFDVQYQATIYPSFIDDLLWRINPVNDNATTYIYKLNWKGDQGN